MEFNEKELLGILGKELVESPFLSVMIINRKYEMVWHNQRFADEFNNGEKIADKKCFQAIGAQGVHSNCPLMKSLKEHCRVKGYLNFGDKNFLFFTIPLNEEYAAKVHIFLPKEPDDKYEEK